MSPCAIDWQAIATFVAGVLAVGAAVVVGWKQAGILSRQVSIQEKQTDIQRRQSDLEAVGIRIELFDRRLEVLDAVDRANAESYNMNNSGEAYGLFAPLLSRASFLFDRPTAFALGELRMALILSLSKAQTVQSLRDSENHFPRAFDDWSKHRDVVNGEYQKAVALMYPFLSIDEAAVLRLGEMEGSSPSTSRT